MKSELEDARKLAHGAYNDVIVAEHRQRAGDPTQAGSDDGQQTSHVVLEMPEGSRVIDWAQTYEIDGTVSATPPKLGKSFRLIVGPPTLEGASVGSGAIGSLRYETPATRSPTTR